MKYFDYSWVLTFIVGTQFRVKKFFIVFLLSCCSVVAMDDRAIKGTYTIFRTKQQCSPLHGFIWKELVKTFYLYGNQAHATIKLIRELFYLNEWDHVSFGCTVLPNKPAAYFSPRTIGALVHALNESTACTDDAIEHITELMNADINSHQLQESLRKKHDEEMALLNEAAVAEQEQLTALKKACDAQLSVVNHLDTVIKEHNQNLHNLRVKHNQKGRSDAHEVSQQLAQAQQRAIVYQQEKKTEQQKLKNARLAYKELEHAISKKKNQVQKLSFDADAVKRLATLLVASYHESSSQQLYLPHTTVFILLAFLWKKAICKADLMTYVRAAVNPQDLVDPQLCEESSDACKHWCDDLYPEQAYLVLRETLTQICQEADTHGAQTIMQRYEELVALLHSYALMTGVLPPLIDPGWTEFEQYRFADCACTALRNLLQALIYDPQTGSLREGIFHHEGLDNFFRQCKNLESIQAYPLRTQWASLVSNLNDDETPADDRIDYKTPPEHGVCEIASRSGLRNILMVLKKLLGLSSFQALVTYITQRTGMQITVDDSCLQTSNVGDIIFTINGNACTFHAQPNHYYCTHQQSYAATDEHIDAIMKRVFTALSASTDLIADEQVSLLWNMASLYRDNDPGRYTTLLHDSHLSDEALSTCTLRVLSKSSTLPYLRFILQDKRLYQQDYWFSVFEALQRTLIKEDKQYIAPILSMLQEAPFLNDTSLSVTQRYKQLMAEKISLLNQGK